MSLWEALLEAVKGFTSAVWPVLNAEMAIGAFVATNPEAGWIVLLLAAIAFSVGHTVGKVALFLAVRHGLARHLSRFRVGKKIIAAEKKLEEHKTSTTLTLFLASLFSLPPLFLLTIALAGTTFSTRRFLSVVLVGRVLRFAFVYLTAGVAVANM